MIGAAKALDAPFAFHASLFAAASLASVFVILNRYFDRPAELPPQEINGRPNYLGSKSYIAWGGVQDAMFQWCHNAVGKISGSRSAIISWRYRSPSAVS
jgi:cbb3-type cytochrome oxidase subunit 1